MEGHILVTARDLTNTAQSFQEQGSQVSNLTSNMMSIVTGLSSVWEGDAAQAYITKFKGLEDDIQKLIAMINEHVTDLNEMASIYDTAETENVNDISSLVSDIIS